MKSEGIAVIFFGCLFATYCFGDPNTQILYETTDLGAGRWQYTYDVYNLGLTEGIDEFTIWFGIGSYDNLVIETLDPPASNWDEVVWDPEPFLGDDGGYDALAKNLNIGVGENVYGFAVSFDWLDTGVPGSQFYEIIKPSDYSTIESGWTVPEPGTLCLLGFGVLVLLRKRKTQNNRVFSQKNRRQKG